MLTWRREKPIDDTEPYTEHPLIIFFVAMALVAFFTVSDQGSLGKVIRSLFYFGLGVFLAWLLFSGTPANGGVTTNAGAVVAAVEDDDFEAKPGPDKPISVETVLVCLLAATCSLAITGGMIAYRQEQHLKATRIAWANWRRYTHCGFDVCASSEQDVLDELLEFDGDTSLFNGWR